MWIRSFGSANKACLTLFVRNRSLFSQHTNAVEKGIVIEAGLEGRFLLLSQASDNAGETVKVSSVIHEHGGEHSSGPKVYSIHNLVNLLPEANMTLIHGHCRFLHHGTIEIAAAGKEDLLMDKLVVACALNLRTSLKVLFLLIRHNYLTVEVAASSKLVDNRQHFSVPLQGPRASHGLK